MHHCTKERINHTRISNSYKREADLEAIFLIVRERLSRIYSSHFKKCRYNVSRRRDINCEKISIGMIYLTSWWYKRRGIMNASLTWFTVGIHSLLILMNMQFVTATLVIQFWTTVRLPVHFQIVALMWI